MQPSTCRSAVLASAARVGSSIPSAVAGKPSAVSCTAIMGATNAPRGRSSAARTFNAKTENSVPAWVMSRQLAALRPEEVGVPVVWRDRPVLGRRLSEEFAESHGAAQEHWATLPGRAHPS
jgi:hypothetical protein